MFGINKAMTDLLLGQFKAKIKTEGIKFIGISPDEKGDLDVRAFKEDMYIISEEMLSKVEAVDYTLYKAIKMINTKTDTTDGK